MSPLRAPSLLTNKARGVGSDPDQRGDTLLEVLVALIIISLSVVALLGVLTTAVTSSAEYRSLTTVETVLKNFADAVKYEAELQSGQTIYSPCATNYQVVSEYPSSAFVGSGITVFATDFASIPAPPPIGPGPTWQVTLIPTVSTNPSIVITSFTNGGPTVTTSNAINNVSATFTLASTQPGGYIEPGTYNVQFSDGSAQDTVTSATTLTVAPSPSVLNPTGGPTSSPVSLTASGFLPTTPVTVTVDGISATINSGGTTDAFGNVNLNFTVPAATPIGSQSVVVSDGSETSSAAFVVGTAGGPGVTSPPPASAVAGDSVQISSVEYWDNSSSTWDTSCGANDDSGIQLINLLATGRSGVNDTVQFVITDPQPSGAPSGPSIALASSPSTLEPGVAITFTATLTPGSPAACNTQVSPATCYPSGTLSWTFTSTNGISPQPCTSPTPVSEVGTSNQSSGSCTIPGSQVTAGTYQVSVSYSGDPAYGAAAASSSVTLAKSTPTLSLTVAPTNPIANEPMVFTATVTGPNGASAPTGTITWSFSSFGGLGSLPCTTPSTLAGSPPSATCTVPGNQVAASPYTLNASYGGDINYLTAVGSKSVTPTAVALTNVTLGNQPGNTFGKIQSGDTIVATFAGPLDQGAFCSAWVGAPGNQTLTNATVTVVNGGNGKNDSMTISTPTCNTQGGFGSLNLGGPGYVKNGNATFTSSSIVWDAGSDTLTITLGVLSPGGGTLNVVFGTSPVYTAGFAIPGSPFTISGGEF